MVLRKTTIYMDPDLHRALRTKAVETGESDLPFEKVIEELHRRDA